VYILADVFRGKVTAYSPKIYPAYVFHGATAVLALFLFLKAVGS
jgi:hypothetical protein